MALEEFLSVFYHKPFQLALKSLNPFKLIDVVFRHWFTFRLATFDVRTRMRIGQQAYLANRVETVDINVRCIQ